MSNRIVSYVVREGLVPGAGAYRSERNDGTWQLSSDQASAKRYDAVYVLESNVGLLGRLGRRFVGLVYDNGNEGPDETPVCEETEPLQCACSVEMASGRTLRCRLPHGHADQCAAGAFSWKVTLP